MPPSSSSHPLPCTDTCPCTSSHRRRQGLPGQHQPLQHHHHPFLPHPRPNRAASGRPGLHAAAQLAGPGAKGAAGGHLLPRLPAGAGHWALGRVKTAAEEGTHGNSRRRDLLYRRCGTLPRQTPSAAPWWPPCLALLRCLCLSTTAFAVLLPLRLSTTVLSTCLCASQPPQVSYMILQRVSPVTHSVGNCVKRVVVIVASVFVFQNPVTRQNALGEWVGRVGGGGWWGLGMVPVWDRVASALVCRTL